MIRSLAAVVFCCALTPVRADGLRLETSEGVVRVLDGDTTLTAYRTDWRVPYLYPLHSPSGANLTRHWPARDDVAGEERDHPHHRSLWLAHGAVNGYDFWSFKGNKEAAIEHRELSAQTSGDDGSVSFTAELAWKGDGKTLLTESRRHRFAKADDKTFILDITSTLRAADGDVVFGDTKEGMFAIRMDRTLRVKGPQAKSRLVNSAGDKDGAAWGKRAKWVATHGPDESDEPAVVALFDHPSNLRHPTWWHARDYGLSAANPFGIHDFESKPDRTLGNHTLKRGEPLTFHYRVVLHHGDLESAGLDRRWESFAAEKP